MQSMSFRAGANLTNLRLFPHILLEARLFSHPAELCWLEV